MSLDVERYLARIDYRGTRTPTLDTLRALHRAHMLSVPFENLNIALGRPIVTGEDALFGKIVVARRGGFCYELNGLFAALLRALGFDVTLLSARVVNAAGEIGPEFDHLTLLVRLDRSSASAQSERMLADVGFGDSFVEPLRLDEDGEQPQASGTYRLTHAGARWAMLERQHGEWKVQYYFGLQPRRMDEFDAMCRFHQSSPQSPFTRKQVCSRAIPGGRITLADSRLIITQGPRRDERELHGEAEWHAALRENFGIEP